MSKKSGKIINHLRGLYEIYQDMSAPYMHGTRMNNIMGYGRIIYLDKWDTYKLQGMYTYYYVRGDNLSNKYSCSKLKIMSLDLFRSIEIISPTLLNWRYFCDKRPFLSVI